MTEALIRSGEPSAWLRSWAAWTPGIEEQSEWARWSAAPGQLATEGAPEVKFLPPAVRRRSTRLTKMMLRAAFDCCPAEDLPHVRSVFASRHGAIHVAVKIFESIRAGHSVSPMQFSHSVHNAQAGLFSIAAANREASSSLAAEEDTFPHAFLETLLHMERSPEQPVLLVIGDEPLPDTLVGLVDEPKAAYACALLLGAEGPGTPIEFALEAGDDPPQARPGNWPQALEFVRWLQAEEPELALGERRRWSFRRSGS